MLFVAQGNASAEVHGHLMFLSATCSSLRWGGDGGGGGGGGGGGPNVTARAWARLDI